MELHSPATRAANAEQCSKPAFDSRRKANLNLKTTAADGMGSPSEKIRGKVETSYERVKREQGGSCGVGE